MLTARRGQGLLSRLAAVLADFSSARLLVRKAMRRIEAAGLPTAVDPKAEVRAFRGASLLEPNLREAEALTGVRVRSDADVDAIAAAEECS